VVVRVGVVALSALRVGVLSKLTRGYSTYGID